MKSDILELIKKTGAVRKFKDEALSKEELEQILEAGRWGLSILGIQPWRFVTIENASLITNIANLVFETSKKIDKPFSLILKLTSTTIKNSKALIVVYNNKKVFERTRKYGKTYLDRARMAELQCIGGAIQNMILEANSIGVGCTWLDSPTFFNEQAINKVINQGGEIVAILSLGYPAETARRSKRAEYNDMIEGM